MSTGLSNRAKGLIVAVNVLLILVFLLWATQGGWWLLLLLPALSSGYRIYRVFRPVDPAAPVTAAARFTEPGDHRVVLQVAGPSPILVIREIRRTTGLGLMAAKQLVEEAPVIVRENLSEASAALVADHLTKAGARALAAPIGEQ
ncbi:ribosomal protein L7/L12 [Kineosporia succinea]|uniref:Ribosomal protein L7/L12 n=1 Tax=Kineosporia succinea TaxID=84632 RepID=A0ABT9P5Z9_9ACTN|nr:ribosomal protein L7/L12 [Kineosporia succinea]MDP9827986.1 ribosomal protein L7/L12 [Kineosporia succinea]